jgi:hypothetical protein
MIECRYRMNIKHCPTCPPLRYGRGDLSSIFHQLDHFLYRHALDVQPGIDIIPPAFEMIVKAEDLVHTG